MSIHDFIDYINNKDTYFDKPMYKKSKPQTEANCLHDVVQKTKRAFYFVGFLSLFINVLMLTAPLYMLQLFDRVLAGRSVDTLVYLSVIALFAIGILSLLEMLRSRATVNISTWFEKKLSPYALAHSADHLLTGSNYGPQSLRDISSIRQFLSSPSVLTFFDFPWFPIYIFIIYMLHTSLGNLALIGAAILFMNTLLNEWLTKRRTNLASSKAISAQQHAESSLRNAEVIQAMGMMPQIISKWFDKNSEVLSMQERASYLSGFILSCSKGVRLALQILMLGMGAYYVILNQITPGVMIVSSIMMARALAPLEQSIGAWKQMQTARMALIRLKIYFLKQNNRVSSLQLPQPQGNLELETVYYVPPNQQKPVLKNISLKIPQGQIVAMIGPSASGKSTLAKLMVGAWPASSGSVRLDGADVYQWDRSDFGKHVGYLPQDVELFSGTVKENIARLGEIDEEAVIAAAKAAGVHELILHLPEGYETKIGTSDYSLSGGQRQRIALARALYNNPTLLILDEPNAHIDKVGEEALVATITELKKRGATVILITHRMPFLASVDSIIILQEGAVQYAGPKNKIIEQLKKMTGYSTVQSAEATK